MKTLFILLFAFLTLSLSSGHADDYETELVRLINVERSKQQMAPLQMDDYLMEVARFWAKDEAKKDKLVHRGNMGVIMAKAGYSGMNENLYYTTFPLTAQSTVEAWMKSPGHRKNILTPGMTLIGVGYALSANGAKYVVFNSAVKVVPKAVPVDSSSQDESSSRGGDIPLAPAKKATH